MILAERDAALAAPRCLCARRFSVEALINLAKILNARFFGALFGVSRSRIVKFNIIVGLFSQMIGIGGMVDRLAPSFGCESPENATGGDSAAARFFCCICEKYYAILAENAR